MKFVINIPEETINRVKNDEIGVLHNITKLIKNGTPLTESDDAVNREQALKPYQSLNDTDVISVGTIKRNLLELPSVQPKPKTDVLDKIRAEIQTLRNCSCSCSDGIIDDVEDIIDKYRKGIRNERIYHESRILKTAL